jgi:hypothetical protein
VRYTVWYMDSILSGLKNAFSGISSGISGVFGKSADDRVVGIDIGTSSIKVVELKKEGGKVILDTYGALALGQYAEAGHIGQVTNLSVEVLTKAYKKQILPVPILCLAFLLSHQLFLSCSCRQKLKKKICQL